MDERISAVVAGHICLDVIPRLEGADSKKFQTEFVPGHLVEVGPATFSTGGAVSNTGLALHKLGTPTRLIGKIGDDLFGQAIRQIVTRADPHLADGLVVAPGATTSYSIILSLPAVDRIFLHCPGANDTFGAEDVDDRCLATARLFHFGYPPIMQRMVEDGGSELLALLRRAKQAGVTTSLDMAFPDAGSAAGRADWVSILGRVLPYVDIFLPSVEEILFLLRRSLYDELCREAGGTSLLDRVTPQLLSDLGLQLLTLGVKIAAIKLGDRGLYLRTGSRTAIESIGRAYPPDPAAWAGREMWAPCFQVDVAGTTGAGDATIAGFLSALLRGLLPEECLTLAVAVGACNVEAADALSGVRSWDETVGRIAGGWARRALQLSAPGWRFDPAHCLWFTALRSEHGPVEVMDDSDGRATATADH